MKLASAAPARHVEQLYVLISAAVIGGVIGYFGRSILPERIFADANRLRLFTADQGNVSPDGSYEGTANLFQALHLVGMPTVVGLLSYGVAAYLIYRCWTASRLGQYTWPTVTAHSVTFLLCGIFLFDYTKEVFVVVLTLALVVLGRSVHGEIVWCLVALGYAAFVREYWFLVVVAYVTARYLTVRTDKVGRRLAIWAPGILAAMTIAFNVLLSVSVTYYRTSVLADLSTVPDSAIGDLVAGDSLPVQWINVTHTWATLLAPYPILLGNPQQMVTGLLLIGVWGAFWYAIWSASSSDLAARSPLALRGICLAYSLSLTLALFEPDYGSYLRHLLPVIPLLVLVGSGSRDKTVGQGAAHLPSSRGPQ